MAIFFNRQDNMISGYRFIVRLPNCAKWRKFVLQWRRAWNRFGSWCRGLNKLITVLTHNKHIFVRPKNCDYFWRSAYFGKWRISYIRYSLLHHIEFSIRIGRFVYNFQKKNLTWQMFLVCLVEWKSMLKEYRLFIFPKSSSFPNKLIFVREKRCAYYGKSAYYV